MKKKKVLLIVVFILLAMALCACGESESHKEDDFKDEDELKEYVIGTWTNASKDIYYVFTDNEYRAYTFYTSELNSAYEETLNMLKDKGKKIKNVSFNDFTKSFHDTWLESMVSAELTWDYKKGKVSSAGETFKVDDGNLIQKSNDSVLSKVSDDVEAYEEKWADSVDSYADKYKAEQEKIDFKYSHSNLPSAIEVQYDKIGHLGRDFEITGKAELDDYYNWDYRGLDSVYYCVRIRPDGGEYKNEWYAYGLRLDQKDLFNYLMENPGANVTLVCEMLFFDTGSDNMATLVDYRVN